MIKGRLISGHLPPAFAVSTVMPTLGSLPLVKETKFISGVVRIRNQEEMLKGADAVTCWMGEPVAEVEQMECKGLVDRDYQWRAIWCSNYIYIMSFFSSAMFLSDFFYQKGLPLCWIMMLKVHPIELQFPFTTVNYWQVHKLYGYMSDRWKHVQ